MAMPGMAFCVFQNFLFIFSLTVDKKVTEKEEERKKEEKNCM